MSNGVKRQPSPIDTRGFTALPNPYNGTSNRASNGSSQQPPLSLHGQSLITRRAESKESIVSAGCLELGREAGRGNVYHTRYHIHHDRQRSHLCKEIMIEEMAPCCGEKARRSCGRLLWAFFRSEAFLFSLHITALALGVIKEAANYREEQEILHLVHSIIETLVSLLMVVIRVISAWTAFYHMKDYVGKVEKLNDQEDRPKHQVQGRSLKHWLQALTAFGVLLIIFLIATFVCFYFFAHLGWTILSNQFALVVISVTSGLYMTRVEKGLTKNSEDQHKAALYEAVLLLQELYTMAANPQTSPQEQADLVDKIHKFTKALKDTAQFGQPDHIKLSDKYKPAQSLTFNAMMQSMV